MSNDKSMLHTFVVYVENKPGVLKRVSLSFVAVVSTSIR